MMEHSFLFELEKLFEINKLPYEISNSGIDYIINKVNTNYDDEPSNKRSVCKISRYMASIHKINDYKFTTKNKEFAEHLDSLGLKVMIEF